MNLHLTAAPAAFLISTQARASANPQRPYSAVVVIKTKPTLSLPVIRAIADSFRRVH